jgi:hypothetical protein
MDNSPDIATVQGQVEGLALLIATYYDALRRANVADELAADLTIAYQDWVLKNAAETSARKAAQQTLGALLLGKT